MTRRRGLYLFAGQVNGRPRERVYATDFRGEAILRATALRRQAAAASAPLGYLVAFRGRDGATHRQLVEVETVPHPIYGVRWWLLCPRCNSRREVLFVSRSGPACRDCLRLRYRRQGPAESRC